jgi:uncharacterized membrane protein (UPF0127 family)
MSWRWILLVAVAGVSCGDDGDEGEASTPLTVEATTTDVAPATASAATTTLAPRPPGVVPEGFATVGAEITAADGSVCTVCLWAAATPEDRARGLMGVTDLGGADGMAFLYDAPTEGDFWMRDTPTPLSIAFFAADGAFVSASDMVPCLAGPAADCPRYGAAGPYTTAIEVFAGDLAGLGIAAGSRLELVGAPCEPAAS